MTDRHDRSSTRRAGVLVHRLFRWYVDPSRKPTTYRASSNGLFSGPWKSSEAPSQKPIVSQSIARPHKLDPLLLLEPTIARSLVTVITTSRHLGCGTP
jgi:hypothetical protein